jgi:hypothetical protein
MGNEKEGQWVVPNSQVPRTFGMMNIVFGALLLLMGVGYIAMWAIAPYYFKQIGAVAAKAQAAQKAERESKIADLKSKEAAAKSTEEKESFQSEREMLEKTAEPDVSEFMDYSNWDIFSDVRLAIYYCTELGTGILLNLLTVVSGVGLLGLAEWARRLAVGVAWGKIVRWVAMTIMTLVLVLPVTMARTQKAFDKMNVSAKGPGAASGPMLNIAQIGAIFGGVTAVFEALIFSIYPGLTIWFLTRPRARAACIPRLPLGPPDPGNELGELA